MIPEWTPGIAAAVAAASIAIVAILAGLPWQLLALGLAAVALPLFLVKKVIP